MKNKLNFKKKLKSSKEKKLHMCMRDLDYSPFLHMWQINEIDKINETDVQNEVSTTILNYFKLHLMFSNANISGNPKNDVLRSYTSFQC